MATSTLTVITTQQADAQLDSMPEALRTRALKLVTKLGAPRFEKATRMHPAPFGEGWLWKFRTGPVRVLAVIDADQLVVVGFGLRQAS